MMFGKGGLMAGGTRRLRAPALAAALAFGLAACGDATPLQDMRESNQMLRALVMGSTRPAPRDDQFLEEEYDPACPRMEVQTGAAYHAVYARGMVPEPRNVQFQARLDRTARECTFLDDQVAIKIGFSGRLLLGPKGAPGSVTLPVVVSFAGKGDRVVWSKEYRLPAALEPGEESTQFVHVAHDLVYRFRPDEDPEDFRLYVGFVETETTVDAGPRRGR